MRITKNEIDNLIILLESSNCEDWKLALNILANPSFKVKRQLCQAVKFARIYVKHPYIKFYYGSPQEETIFAYMSQLRPMSIRCLTYLKLYRDYDKRRIN